MTQAAEQVAEMSGEELASVQKLQDAYTSLKAELAKVIVGQNKVVEELLIALVLQGALPAGGCARVGEDAADFDAGARDAVAVV